MWGIIKNLLIGGALFGLGFSLVVKTESYLNNFGRLEWFEQKLNTEGGSRLGYKLFGFLLIAVGVLTAFGLVGGFLGWLLSPLTKFG